MYVIPGVHFISLALVLAESRVPPRGLCSPRNENGTELCVFDAMLWHSEAFPWSFCVRALIA